LLGDAEALGDVADRAAVAGHPTASGGTYPSPITGPELEREGVRRRLGRPQPDQRTTLLLRAAGFSYREIGERRGWTYTKVNRCVNGAAAIAEDAERGPARAEDIGL
jgi:DNA-directed RNA polymerase specialized sigma24 family protein